MAPKRDAKAKAGAADDTPDLNAVPESDDDRSIVVTISGLQRAASENGGVATTTSVAAAVPSAAGGKPETPRTGTAPAFVPALTNIVFVVTTPFLGSPGTTAVDAAAANLPPNSTLSPDGSQVITRFDPISATERRFALPIFARRVSLNPHLVSALLGGTMKVQCYCSPVAVVEAPKAGGGPSGGAGGAASGKPAPKKAAGGAQLQAASTAQQPTAAPKSGASGAESPNDAAAAASTEPIELCAFTFGLAAVLRSYQRDVYTFVALPSGAGSGATEEGLGAPDADAEDAVGLSSASVFVGTAASVTSATTAANGTSSGTVAAPPPPPPAKRVTNLQTVFPSLRRAFDSLTLVIAVNAPLLGPSNLAKYPAMIVTLRGAHNLPPPGSIEVSSHLGSSSTTPEAQRSGWNGIAGAYLTASVPHPLAKKVSGTPRVLGDITTPRVSHDILNLGNPEGDDPTLVTSRVYFLHALPRMAVLQALYHDSITIRVHDRDRLLQPKKPVSVGGLSSTLSSSGAPLAALTTGGGGAAASAALLNEQLRRPPIVAGPTGIAVVPLRGLFEADGEVDISVPVLPEREEHALDGTPSSSHIAVPPGYSVPPAPKPSDYLSFGTTVKVRVALTIPTPVVNFIPLPAPSAIAPSAPASPMSTMTAGSKGNVLVAATAEDGAGASAAGSPPSSPTAALAAQQLAALNPVIVHDDNALRPDPAALFTRLFIELPYEGQLTASILRALLGLITKYPMPSGECDLVEVMKAPSAHGALDGAGTAALGGASGKEANAKEAAKKDKPGKGGPNAAAAAAAALLAAVPTVSAEELLKAAKKRSPLFAATGDNISGFEIIDGMDRLIVIEGRVSVLTRLAQVVAAIADGSGAEGSKVRVVYNHELPFLRRQYHLWPPLVLPVRVTDGPVAPPVEEPPVVDDVASTKPAPGGKGGAAAAGGGGGTKGNATAGAGGKKGAAALPKPAEKRVAAATEPRVVAGDDPSILISGSEAGELDAGGVGGRLRRIRLRRTLDDLLADSSLFTKRRMGKEALDCILKLSQLRSSPDMVFALDHNAFPTNLEIVALERVLGQCLEVMDITGTTAFVNFANVSESESEQILNERSVRLQKAREKAALTEDVDLSRFYDKRYLGRVVSFAAYPTTPDEAKGLPALSKRGVRYDHKAYMRAIESGVHMPCAFTPPMAPPTQALKFMVTAQIVGVDEADRIMLVMSCESMSKTGTNTRNPEFVAKLRRDEKKLPAEEFFAMQRAKRAAWHQTHQSVDPRYAPYHDDSDDDAPGFVDPVPRIDEAHLDGDAPDAHPHHRRKNMSAVTRVSQIVREAREEQRMEEAKSATRAFEHANALERATTKRLKALSSLVVADDRPSFTTLRQRTAIEDARPALAPSPQRVDDLKQPWTPPVATKDPKAGSTFRFDGARLSDPLKSVSLAAGCSAAEIRRQEEEDRAKAKEAWKERVVVDDTHFHVRLHRPEKTLVVDKYSSMLQDPPRKRAIADTFMPPPPVSIREVEKIIPNERVEPSRSKHPELKRMYYAEGVPKKRTIQPIAQDEKGSPLWYQPASLQ